MNDDVLIESQSTDEQPVSFSAVPVFGGLVWGTAKLLNAGDFDIPHFNITKTQIRSECSRLKTAAGIVDKELEDLAENFSQTDAPTEASAFIEMHRQILNDATLIDGTVEIIKSQLVNAEWALSVELNELRKAFEAIEDDYLSERAEDIAQVVERVQRVLTGRRRTTDTVHKCPDERFIVIAHHLNPADILQLKRKKHLLLAGLIIENGSQTSHTAILARSLEIPTLVGAIGITNTVNDDDVILLDATQGQITLNPDPQSLPDVSKQIRELKDIKRRQRLLINQPCVTANGEPFSLMANIALPEDVQDANRVNVHGVGLFRSEFLFMNRSTLPTEDEQYEAYLKVVRAMKGKPITIRTIDIGGDKLPSEEVLESLGYSNNTSEQNPELGLRAIRFYMRCPNVFKTQIRAILRASFFGKIRILLPLLSATQEVEFAVQCIDECKKELKLEQIPFSENVELGGMIETPAAAIALSTFLPLLRFISIGTNDLIQYTLAVDRHNPDVSYLYNPYHPAVILLLKQIIEVANKAGVDVCLCGEMSADPICAKILLAMGLRNFSMESARILSIKEQLLQADTRELEKTLAKALRSNHGQNISDYFS